MIMKGLVNFIGMWISIRSILKVRHYILKHCYQSTVHYTTNFPAFVWKEDYDKDNPPLDTLQIWDCFDYDITVIKKPLLCDCEFFGKDPKMHKGEYMFTLDTSLQIKGLTQTFLTRSEHKHLIYKIDNDNVLTPTIGLCLQIASLVPERKTPICKYAPKTTQQKTHRGVQDTDEWAYKDKGEGPKDQSN